VTKYQTVFVVGVSLLLASSFGCHTRSAIDKERPKRTVRFDDLRPGTRVRLILNPDSSIPYSRAFKQRGFECFVRKVRTDKVWVDMIDGLVEFEIASKDIQRIEYVGLEFEEPLIEWPAVYIPATLTALLLLMGQ
jgi:hypothetical protein